MPKGTGGEHSAHNELLSAQNWAQDNRMVMGAKWCGFRFPDHVNYFSSRSLRSLAEGVGLAYVRTNWLSLRDDNIIAVLRRPH